MIKRLGGGGKINAVTFACSAACLAVVRVSAITVASGYLCGGHLLIIIIIIIYYYLVIARLRNHRCVRIFLWGCCACTPAHAHRCIFTRRAQNLRQRDLFMLLY
jgi:hypothetical protein